MFAIPDYESITFRVSRRRFLAGMGLGGIALLQANGLLAADDNENNAQFLLEWGGHGTGEGQFDAAIGIAISRDDIVYTSEFRNERVQWFTTDGEFLGQIKVQPHAGGVAVDSAGTIFVAHWNSHKVAAYSNSGEMLREWGQMGTADGEFRLPGSIAIGPDELVYVPDQGNSRVQVFTREGMFVRKFGSLGSEPGQFGGGQAEGGRFAGPQFVSFDREGNVYTTDAALDRVQKFTPEGELLGYWGSESAEPGGFGPPPVNDEGVPITGGPIAICVDRQDRVWVSATNHHVQQFTNDGQFLCSIGTPGSGPGEFDLPHGLALDSAGCLYVCDVMNDRIQKFAVP